MTIGKQGDLTVFAQMNKLRDQIVEKFKIKEEQFELSMGMSADFETAVRNS